MLVERVRGTLLFSRENNGESAGIIPLLLSY
jgi:hypothetical protein